MKKLFLSALLIFSLVIPSFGTTGLDNILSKKYSTEKIAIINKPVDDYTFCRRTYLDLAGRIPTLKEISTYTADRTPQKKATLVNKIINSEDYVNNFYNYWADLLRIRPDRLSDDIGFLKSYPYMAVIRSNIRTDKPLNVWIKDMLDANGSLMANGNSGYLLRDTGMELDNLATTVQIFLGKNLACSQCHNDPFQEYKQLEFYQMAAFFSSTEKRESKKNYNEIIKKVDDEIKQITGKDRIDNNIRQFISANLFSLKDNPAKKLKLPFNYKYDDAKPNQDVIPVSFDGKLKSPINPRMDFSVWITSQKEFSLTYINRIWMNITGKPLITPIDNFDINTSPNKDILNYLADVFIQNNYSTKRLIQEICLSDFYSREAYKGDYKQYNLQSLPVKRLTSYQVWDSLLTLILPDVNYTKVNLDEYAKLTTINWEDISGAKLMEQVNKIAFYEKTINDNILKYKNIDLVRSCFIFNRGSFSQAFLKEFGSSDRILIDSTSDKGSITQILVLMNSPLLDVIMDNKSQLMSEFNTAKNKNVLFTGIMGRPYAILETSTVESADIKDLVWSLINTREFLFRK